MTARRIAALLPLTLLASGCGRTDPAGPEPSVHAVGANDPAWMVRWSPPPPPDADRMNYDAVTRTLTLYELRDDECWHVKLPGERAGRPVPSKHKLPNIDPSEVQVYYARPNGKPSMTVTVRQILDSGPAHVSFRN
jgi:hypothetical protein